jgi:formamidopyrimidine-DNA glycosylase
MELLGRHADTISTRRPSQRHTGPTRPPAGFGYRPIVPEMLEVEYYRRLAEAALARPIASVVVPDRRVLQAPTSAAGLRRALVGRCFTAARRRGKLLLLDTGVCGRGGRVGGAAPDGPTLGIRFGMTGSLVVDDRRAIDRLLYSPGEVGEQWVRWRVTFADGGDLSLHDPRRFGRVALDPDEEALGPDAAAVTPAQLRASLAARQGEGPPLKARLLDQGRLAGIGNLLVDEILWRAGLSPTRPSASLSGPELRRLHRHLRATLDELAVRGGSHTGDLMDERGPGGRCPRDGTELARTTVGGRTTWWCPVHQR